MGYLLGIDIGTTNIKTVVLEAATGRVIAAAEQEHAIHHPQPGFSEQHPDDWWTTAAHTTRRALTAAAIDPAAVRGIGVCGHMHNGVCIDQSGQPVRPAIIWADTRSSPQVDDLRERTTTAELAAIAPGLPAAGFMAPTMMWLAEHEPETLAKTAAVLLPKDYIRLQLTGTVGTEASDAAASWLLDVTTSDWSDALLDLCGLERRYMPPVQASGEVVGELTPEAAEILGLPAGVPVIAGAADLSAQGIGHGVYAPGRTLTIFGSGGQVFNPLPAPTVDPHLRYYVFNHATQPEQTTWYAQAAILSGGLSLRWLKETLHVGSYEQLSLMAADVPPGAGGLVFLPYLAGERTPVMDPLATGMFLGLRLYHEPGHLARAVMEGVTFAMADCLDLVVEQETVIIASGGATKSPVWRQIMADVFNRPVLLAAGSHHAGVGVALLAGIGVGLYDNLAEACALLPEPTTTIIPQPENAAFYAERRTLYQGLYDKLKDEMHELQRGL